MFRLVLAYLGIVNGPEQWPDREKVETTMLQPWVAIALVISTVVMFVTVLVVQEAWVEELERPLWVNLATGGAVIGWMGGVFMALLGAPPARLVLPLASLSGLLAQWGDTLGGEVSFDLGFYRTQGIAIAGHLILAFLLAVVPIARTTPPPQDAVR